MSRPSPLLPPLLVRVVPLWAMWLIVYCFCICYLCVSTEASLALTSSSAPTMVTRHVSEQTNRLSHRGSLSNNGSQSSVDSASRETASTRPEILPVPTTIAKYVNSQNDRSRNRSTLSAITSNDNWHRPQWMWSEYLDDSRPNLVVEAILNRKKQFSSSSLNVATADHEKGHRNNQVRGVAFGSATRKRTDHQHRHNRFDYEHSVRLNRYNNRKATRETQAKRDGSTQLLERSRDRFNKDPFVVEINNIRMEGNAEVFSDQWDQISSSGRDNTQMKSTRIGVTMDTNEKGVTNDSIRSSGRRFEGTFRWHTPEDYRVQSNQQRPQHQQEDHPSQLLQIQQTQAGGGGASNSKKGVKKGQASIVFTAVAGGAVSLPCSLAPVPDEDNEVALVLWYKDDISAPLFTVDARGIGDLQSARQSSLDQLKERANFILISSPSHISASTTGYSNSNYRSIWQISQASTKHRPPLPASAGAHPGTPTTGFAAHLHVQPVRESDEGEYRCRVDFKRARSVNTVVNLRVIVPPGDPVIETRSGVILREGLAGPFNDGDPLTLHCYTGDVGRPRANLVWVAHDGRVIDDTFSYEHIDTHHHQTVVVRNTLEINALNRDHLLTTLACQASNNNITAPSQTSITLDLNLKPLYINVEPSSTQPLSAGAPIEFVCYSSGSRPPAVLTWWKGDQQVQATKEDFSSGGSSSSTSVLTFTPEPEDDGAILACRAENPAMNSNEGERFGGGERLNNRRTTAALEYSRTLDVHYAPKLKLVLGGGVRSGDIREGRDVYLECEITAKPAAHEIVWYFEGTTELHTDKDKGIIVSGSSLVLQAVSRSQRGWYTCSASNREGTTRSNRLFLRVKYAPRCRSQQRRVYGVDLYESARIRCDVEADPEENTHFRWTFNNSMGKRAELDSQPTTASHRTSRSMINYKPLTEQDYGELLCFGGNEVGEQVEPCIIHIVATATPDPLENCSQVNATENSLTVECFEGAWNGGGNELSALSFVAELYRSDENDLKNGVAFGPMIANVTVKGSTTSASTGLPSVPVFVFNDLPRIDDHTSIASGRNDVGYRVHIYARNHKGRSPVTTLIVHLLNPSKYQTKPPASETHSTRSKSALSVLEAETTDADQCKDSTEVIVPLSDVSDNGSNNRCDSVVLRTHSNLVGTAESADDIVTADSVLIQPDIIQRQQMPPPLSTTPGLDSQQCGIFGIMSTLSVTRTSTDKITRSDSQVLSGDIYRHRLANGKSKKAGSGSNLSHALTTVTELREDDRLTAPHQAAQLGVYATLHLYSSQPGFGVNDLGNCGSLNMDCPIVQPTNLRVSPLCQQAHNSSSVSNIVEHQRSPVATPIVTQSGDSLWTQPNEPFIPSVKSPSIIGSNLSSNLLHNDPSLIAITTDIVGTDFDDGGFIVIGSKNSATGRTAQERWKQQEPSGHTELLPPQSRVSPLLPNNYTSGQFKFTGVTSDSLDGLNAGCGDHAPNETIVFSQKFHFRRQLPLTEGGITTQLHHDARQQQKPNGNSVESTV
ncbi:uncharacterized protein LOC111249595 isoform X4 [Varroa destructor]|uniref:Ig-like domain-containing protein n=1 Tax=Varroa destructor TaxID=109461 RepID=A0A7M7K2H5_VARDE|nr:uncharacterized protein LOC111249595 isoform X4 [Varroa destructor]